MRTPGRAAGPSRAAPERRGAPAGPARDAGGSRRDRRYGEFQAGRRPGLDETAPMGLRRAHLDELPGLLTGPQPPTRPVITHVDRRTP
ncbi:hypothetical protein [Streptomyces sp. NE06-03C]|uniref:hypothetical protein n=1 Tax=Streptomyces sp. NE06-03C TaxID=3028694 RepID=UPI0029C0E429|nr:hypothetical protein [Streptomyces sp. NE06-03C]